MTSFGPGGKSGHPPEAAIPHIPEGLSQSLVDRGLRPQGGEGPGEVDGPQARLQDGCQVLYAALDEPFRLDGLGIDLAVNEVRPAEEEGVGQEHLQVDERLGTDLPRALPHGGPDLREQGLEGREVVVLGVEAVLGDLAQGVEERGGGGEGRGSSIQAGRHSRAR